MTPLHISNTVPYLINNRHFKIIAHLSAIWKWEPPEERTKEAPTSPVYCQNHQDAV